MTQPTEHPEQPVTMTFLELFQLAYIDVRERLHAIVSQERHRHVLHRSSLP